MELCLSESEIKLIDEYIKQELPIEKLNLQIVRKLDFKQADELLDFYIKSNDNINFWRTLWIMPKSYSLDERLKLFTKYLLDYRHSEYEEMIGVLFEYSDILENIYLIKTLIENVPKYFYNADRQYVFIKKCFFNLQKYKFPETLYLIQLIYRNSDDDTIKKMAKHIIEND